MSRRREVPGIELIGVQPVVARVRSAQMIPAPSRHRRIRRVPHRSPVRPTLAQLLEVGRRVEMTPLGSMPAFSSGWWERCSLVGRALLRGSIDEGDAERGWAG